MQHLINKEISVDVPADMEFIDGGTGPGAFDYIRYKGYLISYLEADAVGTIGLYTGPFIVLNIMKKASSLDNARVVIDAEIKRLADKLIAPKNNPTEMVLTISQALSLYQRWLTANNTTNIKKTFEEFLAGVSPTIGCDGAVVVEWCGMWLCIEKDGYCHT